MIALIHKLAMFEWIVAFIMGINILIILPTVKKGMDKWIF